MRFCSLASGSSGNCQYVGSKKSGILIDAGLSGKYIRGSLESLNVDLDHIKAVLVTHEHSDHIKGAGIIARKLKIPVIGTKDTLEAMAGSIKMDSVRTVEIEKGLVYDLNGEAAPSAMEEEEIYVRAFGISHDSADPVGFTVFCNGVRMSSITDIGCMTQSVIDEAKESDFILLEANHDVEMLKMGPYPFYLKKRILSEKGHLSNDDAALAALEIARGNKTKGILLGHLSRENNFPDLAYETVSSKLREHGIEAGSDLKLEMTFRDKSSNFLVLE